MTIQHANLLFVILIVHLKIIFIFMVRIDESIHTAPVKATFYYGISVFDDVTERASQVNYLVLALVERAI